jgi:Protein of unknown function (DUF3306)
MSDPENFLSRWSRRKLEVSQDAEPVDPPVTQEPGEDRTSGKGAPDGASVPVEPDFDLASLPSIETITAETDISGFLAAGVPSELARAALRRAWASDPKIRNFVGLADYAWDFNAAGSMAGFGPLEMSDEVGKMVGRMAEPDHTAADASHLPDPVSTTPKTRQTAGETGSDGNRAVAIEDDNHTTQGGDGRMTNSGASPHRDEPIGGSRENIAVRDKAESSDASGSFVKRQHGGALPK